LRALFDRQAAQGFSATIALRLGENQFSITIADGELHLTRGVAERPAAALDTDRPTLAALLYGGRRLDDAVRAGDATIAGKTAVLTRFLRLFPLPQPAGDT
jgi:alkyl sulfatase BDS1-like metallo-beta-lactamase superfamily hydrolase